MFGDSLEGRNLGRYRVLEPLGRGGMARVYRAYHAQLDRYVAVKVLRSDLVEEEEFLARFRREAQAVAGLRHPNVVQVYDFDAQDNAYYMVMELLEGDTLRTRLNDYRVRGERMPLGEVARIMLDILAGLGYAHSQGMVHRDVKPANILLTRGGQAVLTDFGIAQIVGGTQYTVSGALMGTLAYMAPEQGLEGQCDVRSNLYSLGIVFYEMLLGEPPFDAETPLAILMKHVNDPLPPPRKRDSSIPKPLEKVVLKTLSKRPQDRFQSAGEMAEALQQAAKKSGIEVPARISLPLSFTTSEAPSEPVAVLSGTAREQVEDVEFAVEDTDFSLGQRLAAGAAVVESAPRVEPEMGVQEPERQTPEAVRASWSKRAPSPPPAPGREMVPVQGPAEPVEIAVPPKSVTVARSIVEAIVIVAAGNLIVVFIGLFTRWWGVYSRGWPFELLLVSLGLILILEATANVWLLIPTGIILGNGILFSFYAITNAWAAWNVLWPLEPLLIIGTVWGTIRLAGDPVRARQFSLRFAHRARRPILILLVFVVVMGAIVG